MFPVSHVAKAGSYSVTLFCPVLSKEETRKDTPFKVKNIPFKIEYTHAADT